MQNMNIKGIMKLIESYLRYHPSLGELKVFENIVKATYNYSSPYTNSKSKVEKLHAVDNINQHEINGASCMKLTWIEEKGANRIEISDSFDSILTEEVHGGVLQDDVFGQGKRSKDGNRWVYVAKCKEKKNKSYFLGGEGKNKHVGDFGEGYEGVSEVGIFIWDLKHKQLLKVYSCQGEDDVIPACPVFANDEGNKVIFHGYKRKQFAYGLLHCFNRECAIYETSVEGQDKMETKIIKNVQQTNMFPAISPCYQYLAYFGGEGITHTYYLDLMICKKEKDEWKEVHRIKGAGIGLYSTLKTFAYQHAGKPYLYYQTIEKAVQKVMRVQMQTGQVQEALQPRIGESYALTDVMDTGLALGKVSTHQYNSFFTLTHAEAPYVLPPLASEQFLLEELQQPLHSFYLQSKSIDEEFMHNREKRPLVVMAHGGPHASVDPSLTLMRYVLLKAGYVLLMPNFSGSVGFGSHHLQAALGSIGQVDAQQILQCLHHVLKQKPYIDRERVHMVGGSYGGYMGAIMGSRHAEDFKSIVIMNGVISIPGNFWFSDIPEWSVVESLKTDKIECLSGEDYVKMVEQSPLGQPMKVPTLQFLGAKDRRVPYRQGLLFDAMTKKTGSNIQTYVYENSSHSLSDSVETQMDIIAKTISFLETNSLP